VRVNAVSPGAVHTKMTDPLLSGVPGAKEWWTSKTPLDRIGTPEEVAELALYLATATYTTGQVHVIDGGWTA